MKNVETYLQSKNRVNLFNSNTPLSAFIIHNGLECINAKMKLSVLGDINHFEKEKMTGWNKLTLTFSLRGILRSMTHNIEES